MSVDQVTTNKAVMYIVRQSESEETSGVFQTVVSIPASYLISFGFHFQP